MFTTIFLSFIKWENFTDWGILAEWLKNLLFIFSFIYITHSFSYAVVINKFHKNFNQLSEFCIRYLLGVALLAFLISFLGLSGLYNTMGLLVAFLLLTFLAFLRQKRALWLSFNQLKYVLKENKWLWLIGILISLNSLLLPFRNDEVTYHLAYPLLWFQNSTIFLEDSMRYPTYTFNFNVLALVGLVFKSSTIVHLLHWSVGIVGALFIKSVIQTKTASVFLANLAFVSFLFTPIIQEFLNTFHIDIAYHVYLFTAVYLLIQLNNSYDRKVECWIAGAIISAFFVGIKLTGFFYIPLFLIIIFFPFKSISKTKVIASAVMIILSSIWYLRSFILTGDPLWPAINLNLIGNDLFWNIEDLEMMNNLIKKGQINWGWKIIYMLPKEMLLSTNTGYLVGWPVLGYALFGILAVVLFFKRILRNTELMLLSLSFLCTIALWLATSIQIRYAYFILFSLFFSLYALSILKKKFVDKSWQRILYYMISIGIVIGPLPTAYSYSKNFFAKPIHLVEKKARFQAAYDSGEINSIYALRNKEIIPENSIIYTLGFTEYRYYFYDNYFYIKGDVFGNYRFRDYINLIHEKQLSDKLRSLDIEYLLISNDNNEEVDLILQDDFLLVFSNEYFLLYKLAKK